MDRSHIKGLGPQWKLWFKKAHLPHSSVFRSPNVCADLLNYIAAHAPEDFLRVMPYLAGVTERRPGTGFVDDATAQRALAISKPPGYDAFAEALHSHTLKHMVRLIDNADETRASCDGKVEREEESSIGAVSLSSVLDDLPRIFQAHSNTAFQEMQRIAERAMQDVCQHHASLHERLLLAVQDLAHELGKHDATAAGCIYQKHGIENLAQKTHTTSPAAERAKKRKAEHAAASLPFRRVTRSQVNQPN